MNIFSINSVNAGAANNGAGASPVLERSREETRQEMLAQTASQTAARKRRQEQQAQLRLGPSPSFNRKLEYEVDHRSHDLTVKVIDGETDKVIRTLPSEEFREMRENIREAIGLLFDKHA